MSVFDSRMHTRAINSLEGATVHHSVAMQSRTVAHSLRIDNRRRQAATLRHPERRRLGREKERYISFEPRVSPRGVFGELHPGEMCGKRPVTFPRRRSCNGNTHVHVNNNICVRSLERVSRMTRLPAIRSYLHAWNTPPSSPRSGRNRLTREDERRARFAHPERPPLPRQQLRQRRGSIPWNSRNQPVTSAVVNYTISGQLMTHAKFSRFAPLLDAEALHFSEADRRAYFIAELFTGDRPSRGLPWKLTSIREFGRWNPVWCNHPSSTLTAKSRLSCYHCARDENASELTF